MTAATDYAFTSDDARALAAIAQAPINARRHLLNLWRATEGPDHILELFAQFIGMANSVVANNREMVEIILTVEGGMHPYSAEQANLPTITGALAGARLAQGVDEALLCHGCAFRVGTPANQSPVTTIDADLCADPGSDLFQCHEDVDARGRPHKACAGFAQLRARRKRGAE